MDSPDRTFNYFISVEPLTPPIGGTMRFVAKIAYFYDATSVPERALKVPIGESWGTTEDEAFAKLEAKIQAWIAAQTP